MKNKKEDKKFRKLFGEKASEWLDEKIPRMIDDWIKNQKKPNKSTDYHKSLENNIYEAKELKEKYRFDILPSEKKLIELGYGGLNGAINRYHGGFSKFRELLGEEQSKKHYGYWTLEKTISESNKIMKEHDIDILPSKNKLKELGYSGLGATIAQYYGGMANFKELLGQELSTKPEEYLKSINDTLFTANKIMDRNKKGIQNIKEANKQSYSLKEIMDLAGVYIPLGDDDAVGELVLA